MTSRIRSPAYKNLPTESPPFGIQYNLGLSWFCASHQRRLSQVECTKCACSRTQVLGSMPSSQHSSEAAESVHPCQVPSTLLLDYVFAEFAMSPCSVHITAAAFLLDTDCLVSLQGVKVFLGKTNFWVRS